MAFNPVTSGSETLTVAGTSVGFTTIPPSAQRAVIQVLNAPIRFYVDGTTPTASTGYKAVHGHVLTLFRDEMKQFRAIRETGVSALVPVTYYSGDGRDDVA